MTVIHDRNGKVLVYLPHITHDSATVLAVLLAGSADGRKTGLLENAVLDGMDLSGIDFKGACLDGASFQGARLAHACFAGCRMIDANFCGADLTKATFRGADLSQANFARAKMAGADLTCACLLFAKFPEPEGLLEAYTSDIEHDLYEVLSKVPEEVLALRKALYTGRINGAFYNPDPDGCACLIGTIAKLRGTFVVPGNEDRPIEKFVLGIRLGDTPSNSSVANALDTWIVRWLNSHRPDWTEEWNELMGIVTRKYIDSIVCGNGVVSDATDVPAADPKPGDSARIFAAYELLSSVVPVPGYLERVEAAKLLEEEADALEKRGDDEGTIKSHRRVATFLRV